MVLQSIIVNSWEICHRCAKILLAAEHKMQLANSWKICCRCVEISRAQGNFHNNSNFSKNKETNVFNRSLCSCDAAIESFDI